MKKLLILAALLAFCGFAPSSAHAQVCASANEPVTINTQWTNQACNAQSAGNPLGCDGAVNCESYAMGWFHDVAVNMNDSATMFCDADSQLSVFTFAVSDNALGTGTVNTTNSAGNTNVVGASGTTFTSSWVGGYLMIDATLFQVITFTDGTHIVVSGNVGSKTGVTYYAGNKWSPVTGQFSFNNNDNPPNVVRGQEFYLAASAYAKSSAYTPVCEFTWTTGGGWSGDVDTGVSLFRQTGGVASSGLDVQSGWTTGTSNATGGQTCPSGTCVLQSTTPSVTPAQSNDLIIAVQQQGNAPLLGVFSQGAAMKGCDNDGTSVAGAGFGGFYYTACSPYAGTSAITFTSYETNTSDNYCNLLFALKPQVSGGGGSPPSLLLLGVSGPHG